MTCQIITADATGPIPDAVLLRKVLHQIETDPKSWNQETYRCRTAMCFAGWASQLAGGQWLSEDGSALIAEEGEEGARLWDGSAVIVGAHERAERVLGLTEDQADDLFAGGNDLREIRRIVAVLINEVHHVTIRIVPENERMIGEALADGRAPLEVMEWRPGQPTMFHGGERGIATRRLRDHARVVADRLGVPYIDPIDPAAMERLTKAEAA